MMPRLAHYAAWPEGNQSELIKELPGTEKLRHGPCLGDTTARIVGRIAIVNFCECPKAIGRNGLGLCFEEAPSLRFIPIDAEVSQSERAKQPAPDCALVI